MSPLDRILLSRADEQVDHAFERIGCQWQGGCPRQARKFSRTGFCSYHVEVLAKRRWHREHP